MRHPTELSSLRPSNLHGPAFCGLDTEVRAALATIGRRQSLAPGQLLFEQGTGHTHTYVIEQGLVRTYYTAHSGREVTLCFWAEGDLAGGPNFFGGSVHVWSGVATRATKVLAVPGNDLRALAAKMPKLALWIADIAMFKLKWVSLLFQVLGTEPVPQRLTHLLLMLCDIYGVREGDAIVLRHRLNQSDLSTLHGTSRQWTNKAMGELKQLGLVRTDEGRIAILDMAGLARRARSFTS